MTTTSPTPPRGLKAQGRRLWSAMLADYEFDEHELALLREATRTVDLLDDLAAIVASEGLMVAGPSGDRVHPALVEARQAKIALARLLAALRLPAGEDGDHQAGSRRPQRRGGVRGVYVVNRTSA